MNRLKIDIDVEQNRISVWNNGRGIPVVMHEQEKVYVPELVMGHLLTGSNFNDSVAKITGGRNGYSFIFIPFFFRNYFFVWLIFILCSYGAKLCNIFSRLFQVETLDSTRGLLYRQVWHANMTKCDPPIIEKAPVGASDFTCVTFEPDLERFGNMKSLKETAFLEVIERRAHDAAGNFCIFMFSFKKYLYDMDRLYFLVILYLI